MLFFYSALILLTVVVSQPANHMRNFLTVHDIIECYTTNIKQHPQYELTEYKHFRSNPMRGYKVNFRLKIDRFHNYQLYFYKTPIQEILGYQDKASGKVIALYLIIDRNEKLLQQLNKDIGHYHAAGGHGTGDEEIELSYFFWNYNEYEINLSEHVSSYSSYQPHKQYYSLIISKYSFDTYLEIKLPE